VEAKLKYCLLTVIKQNSTVTNSAHFYLSVCFQTEISSKQIYPANPKLSLNVDKTTFPHKRHNPGGISSPGNGAEIFAFALS